MAIGNVGEINLQEIILGGILLCSIISIILYIIKNKKSLAKTDKTNEKLAKLNSELQSIKSKINGAPLDGKLAKKHSDLVAKINKINSKKGKTK